MIDDRPWNAGAGQRPAPARAARARSGRCVLSSAVFLCIACETADRPDYSQPALVPVDSIVLSERDSVFVGQPTGFAPSPDGGYIIADRRNGTIHHFAADGTHLRTIGQRGRGPGEFGSGPSAIAVDGDSLLFAQAGLQLSAFDYRSAEFRWQRALPPFARALAAHDGSVLFSRVDRERQATLGVTAGPSDEPRVGGPFPAAIARSELVAQYFSFTQAAPIGTDSVIVAVQSSDFLFVGPFQGPFDSLLVPVVRRRGSRPDLLAQITHEPQTAEPVLNQLSVPWAVTRLNSGELAVVAFDPQLVSHSRFAGTLFVSIVDPSQRRACPDGEVPAPADPQPWVAFRGDTLLVLIQDVADDRAWTAVRKYLVRTDRCAWIRSE